MQKIGDALKAKHGDKVSEIRDTLPRDEKDLVVRAEDTLKQVDGIALVAADIGLATGSVQKKEEIIQLILSKADLLLNAAMSIAKEEKIEFSYQGMDLEYVGKEQSPTLVHPDTARADRAESRMRSGWDSSNSSCYDDYEGYDDEEMAAEAQGEKQVAADNAALLGMGTKK